jgi:hypothetical protein
MKKLLNLLLVLFFSTSLLAQSKNVNIIFENDYEDIFHLALVVYMADGKGTTRVSNVEPNKIKSYDFPIGSEIFIANWKQEAFAMKGNDLKKAGVKPYKILTENDNKIIIKLSTLSNRKD